jgi:hypothetical protein
MPALSGQVITTIRDGSGNVVVEVTWFFDPTTRVLRNNPTAWTDADGTVWPVNAGALIGNNMTSPPRTVKVNVNDDQGNLVRRVALSAGGRAVKAAALAALTPPDGPYTSADDFNGLTFDLS